MGIATTVGKKAIEAGKKVMNTIGDADAAVSKSLQKSTGMGSSAADITANAASTTALVGAGEVTAQTARGISHGVRGYTTEKTDQGVNFKVSKGHKINDVLSKYGKGIEVDGKIVYHLTQNEAERVKKEL